MTQLQLRFNSNLDYQLEAIQAVVDLFAGLPRREHAFQLGDEIIPNLPAGYPLDEELLRDNLTLVQRRLPKDPRRPFSLFSSLDVDEGDTLDPVSAASHRHPNFTVEMETGTGKTYVYLRTVHELFRQVWLPQVRGRRTHHRHLRGRGQDLRHHPLAFRRALRQRDHQPHPLRRQPAQRAAQLRRIVVYRGPGHHARLLQQAQQPHLQALRAASRRAAALPVPPADPPHPHPRRAAEHGQRPRPRRRCAPSTRSSPCATAPPTKSRPTWSTSSPPSRPTASGWSSASRSTA